MRLLSGKLALCLVWLLGLPAARSATGQEAVKIIAGHVATMKTASGTVQMPLDLSLDWSKPQPGITRAVIYLHGKGRDVDGYYKGLERAAHEAGGAADHAILLAPQFLNETDTKAHGLPESIVRWRTGVWEAGVPATGPAPVSAYDVLDAMLLHLADRGFFPDVTDVVLAGHSGGGQAVQRYAVVGRAPAELRGKGIRVRFVIANPSSFLYFSDDRPARHGFACSGWDRWKYGTRDAPEYVKLTAGRTWAGMEAAYAAADVIYLAGEDDTDPEQKDLDTTCAGEAEGPTRLARATAYYGYVKARHPEDFQQRLWLVPGVAHSGPRMAESPCGVKALFATGTCADQ